MYAILLKTLTLCMHLCFETMLTLIHKFNFYKDIRMDYINMHKTYST